MYKCALSAFVGVYRSYVNLFTNKIIILTGMTGGFQSGLNYQRLEEECWQSQPNIASEFSTPGFVREKKVDMEDNGDEHVLYVQ